MSGTTVATTREEEGETYSARIHTAERTTSHEDEKEQGECHDSDTAASISEDTTSQEPANKNHQRPWWGAILGATALVVAVVTITVVLVVRQPRRTGTTTSASVGHCPTLNVSLLPFLEDGPVRKLHNITWYYPTTLKEFGLEKACLACYTKPCYVKGCGPYDRLICTNGKGMIFGVYNNLTETCVAGAMSHVCLQGSLNLSSLTPQQIKRSRDPILSDLADGINVTTEYLRDEFHLKCEVTGAI